MLLDAGLAPEKNTRHDNALALAIVVMPLLFLLLLGSPPALDLRFENHWFHFQIVSFVCLVALVLGVTTLALLDTVRDARAFFIPVGLGAIAGIFLIHGLSTPGILEFAIEHSEHTGTVGLFARPDLTVTWSAPLSLVVGAGFFALASLHWSNRATEWLATRRRLLLVACALAYTMYALIAFAFPLPFEVLAGLMPVTRYAAAALAGLLYLGAAWRFWNAYRKKLQRLDAAIAIAAVFLAEALIPMVLLPTWSLGWWLYHVLMLLGFCLALGAVVLEYERARHFQLTTYFTAVSISVAALLALVAGNLVTQLVAPLVPPTMLNLVQWGATAIFLGMAALMFSALWLVVRRGDKLLQEHSLQLQNQQAALERGRIAEALVPIGMVIGTSLDLDNVLNLICRESHRLFQVDTTLLWYREGDELIAQAAFGHDREVFLGMRQPITNNPLLGARVVREKRAVYENYAQTSRGVSMEIVRRLGIQSILGVPLMSDGEVLGSLILIDLRSPIRFGELDLDVARLFAQQAAQALVHARLYEKIQQQANALTHALGELRMSYNQTLAALSAALDARDRETEGHSRRVTAYALLLADTLNIQDPRTREAIEWGALLHDVGKIGVPDAILHKPGRLTEEEWGIMRRHPDIGYRILQSIPFLQPAFAVVRHHHERWDGTGYPLRLQGHEIPLPARIFALADTLDSMTTHRPYRSALPFETAFLEITRQRGTQFDPTVVDAFVTISEETWRQVAERIRVETRQVEPVLEAIAH